MLYNMSVSLYYVSNGFIWTVKDLSHIEECKVHLEDRDAVYTLSEVPQPKYTFRNDRVINM